MKIVVCIRQGRDGEINPFDACAYEAALEIPNSEVIILSMGPISVKDFLFDISRLGAKRAILLNDEKFIGSDTLATAYTLSCAIKLLNPDLVFCGKQTLEGDTGQTGIMLSQMLGFNLITNVLKINNAYGSICCRTREFEKVEKQTPALLTIERINKLRLPSIRSKPIGVEILSSNDLNIDIKRCGLSGSPTRVIESFSNNYDKRKCVFIDKSEFKTTINNNLNNNKNKFRDNIISKVKLDKVCIVGKKPKNYAESVCDNIILIDSANPDEICKIVLKENPNAVLFDSSYQGKKLSSLIAAKLRLGLCADCTSLETDGKELFMIRPALSGSVIAKIKSNTKPALATVKTEDDNNQKIIFSVGFGAVDYIEKIKELAKKFNAQICSSRKVVDNDYLEYEKQVGLTGKIVSPDIYVTFGLSGAVHHIVGMKNSSVVISVNNDKNAPIFEYSDYGICCDLKDFFK